MYHKRQLAAWVLAGSSLCFAHTAGRLHWLWTTVLIMAQSCMISYIMYAMPEEGYVLLVRRVLGRWGSDVVLTLTLGWTALMAGFAAALTAEAFPGLPVDPLVPLTILALSAWSCHSSPDVPARVSTVLLPFLVAFFALVAIFGWRDADVFPEKREAFDLRCICVLTLPMAVTLLRCGEGKTKCWFWVPAALIWAALLAWTSGAYESLYEACMSIHVFGVMERFEALLSAAMAAGGYSLCALLGSSGMGLIRAKAEEKKKTAKILFWIVAIAGMALTKRQNTVVLLVCNLLFWGILPVGILWIAKSKKDEKRC